MMHGPINIRYWFDILTGTDHTEDLGEDGRVIFKMQLSEMGHEANERMKASHYRLQWQALIKHCSTKSRELE